MYRKNEQMRFEDFVFAYGTLDSKNNWVKMAQIVPWDEAEREYAKQFVNNGHPAHPARIALGALIIKQRLQCSDEWTVQHVSENPYLQYFLGLKEYSSQCPFGASTMVEFRKRFPPEAIEKLLAASASNQEDEDNDAGKGSGHANKPAENDFGEDSQLPANSGTLLMDATCCPADVSFPQDFKLLNKAREKLESLVIDICTENGYARPRMRHKQARRDYLNLSKSKKRSAKNLRSGIRKQLNYVFRDLGYIIGYIGKGVHLEAKQYEMLNTITTLYEQQLYMYEQKTHSVPDRIVSLSQPWVRPIVRGKAHANTEFGAKLHISMVEGYARIERLSFDAFNEAVDFFEAIEPYRKQHGFYPARVLADKIYRNRETISWCVERHIQLTGSGLGRPPKDQEKRRKVRKQEYQDICDRNIVEGEFGTGKRAYGLGRIMAHLPETSFCVIGIALLCMNLTKRLRSLLRSFFRALCAGTLYPALLPLAEF